MLLFYVRHLNVTIIEKSHKGGTNVDNSNQKKSSARTDDFDIRKSGYFLTLFSLNINRCTNICKKK